MLAGVSLFTACSAPKYSYNFGYYRNSNAKLKDQPVVTPVPAEAPSNEVFAPVVSEETPVYASVSNETSIRENESTSRVAERVKSLQTKSDRIKTDLTLTKSEHKAARKELRQELKSFTKEIKKSPLNKESVGAEGKGKSQLAALLLAIFLGGLGVHDFYLGHIGRGIIKIVLLGLGFLVVPLIALAAWVLVDIILIAIGTEKPKGGEYSKTL